MRKRIRIIAVIMMLALSTIFTAMPVATTTGDYIPIQPFWSNVDSIRLSLASSNNTANCGVRIVGRAGTTRISATITLAQVNANGTLTTIRTWSNQSVSGDTLNFSGTNAITSGNTYRLSVTANVTRNGVVETVTDWTERKL